MPEPFSETPADLSPEELLDGEPVLRAASPLWMVARAPVLNRFVVEMQRSLRDYEGAHGVLRLSFSRAEVQQARAEFMDMIRDGERALHHLAGLLARHLLGTFQLRSVAIGEVEKTRERFTLSVDVSPEEVLATTDLDLGTRVLARLAIADQRGWLRAQLVSNVVEYEPAEPSPRAVYRILTRIKAEEEIWNKVADELFELDRIVLRDKQLRHMGRFVKDVFGIKIVVGSQEDARRVQEELTGLRFAVQTLAVLGLPVDEHHECLRFLEVKDYLTRESRKQSGWAAMKSVVRWGQGTFEIQVQPLSNFLHERERLTKESHRGFKETRERVRDEVAARIPLFGFTRSLLRWLFIDPTADPPTQEGVEVVLRD
ncbi:MAG: hypothetical protein ACO3JL_08015 [Myxococcota bacterium]